MTEEQISYYKANYIFLKRCKKWEVPIIISQTTAEFLADAYSKFGVEIFKKFLSFFCRYYKWKDNIPAIHTTIVADIFQNNRERELPQAIMTAVWEQYKLNNPYSIVNIL
jgi:hypothetical protein